MIITFKTNVGLLVLLSSLSCAAGSAQLTILSEGKQVMDGYGFCAGSAGDVNGDGLADLFVSAPFFESHSLMCGAVTLYTGGPNGPQPGPLLTGNQDKQEFGRAACPAGDVNGDGFDDLLIGAPNTTDRFPDEGAVYLYLGSENGIAPTPAWTATGGASHSGFGYSVAGVGDVNGDGFDDVLVGAPFYERAEGTHAGLIRLYLGGAEGLSPEPAWEQTGQKRSTLGWALCGGRDLNGDTFPDFAVAAPGDVMQQSYLNIYSGGTNDLGKPIQTISSRGAHRRLGESGIALADINGDGNADLLAMPKIPKSDSLFSRPLWISYGDDTRLATPQQIEIVPPAVADQYRPVFQCLDINSDGVDDIVIGNAFSSFGHANEGELMFIPGSTDGLQLEKMTVLNGMAAERWLGETVAPAGDLNGDGKMDLLVTGRTPVGPRHRGTAMLMYSADTLPGSSLPDFQRLENQSETYEARFKRVKADRLDRHMVDQPYMELLEMGPRLIRLAEDSGEYSQAEDGCWMLGYLENYFGNMDLGLSYYKHTERFKARRWHETSCKWHRSTDLSNLAGNRWQILTSQGRIADAGPVIRQGVEFEKRSAIEGQGKKCRENCNTAYKRMPYQTYASMAVQHWNEGRYRLALEQLNDLAVSAKAAELPTTVHHIARQQAIYFSFLGNHDAAYQTVAAALENAADPHYREEDLVSRLLAAVLMARKSGFSENLLVSARADSELLRALDDAEHYLTSRLNIAELLFHAARYEESIHELDPLIDAAEKSKYFVLQAEALELRARNHLALGNIQQAAADCRAALNMFRQMGLKYREPDLYFLYAQCEYAFGRTEQSSNTWKTGRNLAEELGLSNLWNQTAGRLPAANPITPGSSAAGPVAALLPSVMTTEVLPGRPVRARFQLSNLTESEQEGVLFIEATQAACRFELPVIHIERNSSIPTAQYKQPLVLPPLGTQDLYLEVTDGGALAGTEIALYWSHGNGTAAWMCIPADPARAVSQIVHASFVASSPFDGVAFYHEVNTPDTLQKNTNLRAAASHPCRIEFLDLSSGTFLAADANGDGDFHDAGDVIWQDADGDLYPDISGTAGSAIELRVFPLGDALPGTINIMVGRRNSAGKWVDEALNVLKVDP